MTHGKDQPPILADKHYASASTFTPESLRRGAFTSVNDLTSAIKQFIKVYNDDPKPFVWNAKVDDILRKVGECKAILETVH